MSEDPFRIIQWPKDAGLLRRVARPIRDDEFGTPELAAFGAALGDTMMRANGMGLASTQVAEAPGGEPWAMFAIRLSPNGFAIICNPEIQVARDFVIGPEACLSFASVGIDLKAPETVVFVAQRTNGTQDGAAYEGVNARCVFHECEHLKGRTLVDRIGGPMARSDFMRQVAKARRKAR